MLTATRPKRLTRCRGAPPSGRVSAGAVSASGAVTSPDWRRHAGAAGIALVLGILAAAHGGYFPTSWGWSTLVFLWALLAQG